MYQPFESNHHFISRPRRPKLFGLFGRQLLRQQLQHRAARPRGVRVVPQGAQSILWDARWEAGKIHSKIPGKMGSSG